MKTKEIMTLKKAASLGLLGIFISISAGLSGQDGKYYPKGDPGKWNFEVNPWLWLPVVGGEIKSEYLTEEFKVPAIDLVQNLEFAFMINADVSKGKFFASPTYIYTKLGTDKVLKTDDEGNDAIVALPEIKMNIVELITGMRFDIGEKVYMDPFVGFRYNNYQASVEIEGVLDTNFTEKKSDFWDPILGLRVHYYPHPRVPLTFRSGIGGFGVGSDFTWSASVNGGYSLSPTIDLIAGITAYNVDFVEETDRGTTVGLATFMYGFNLGIKVMIPHRYKDPSLFKKKGKK